jgi:hypothetical protein
VKNARRSGPPSSRLRTRRDSASPTCARGRCNAVRQSCGHTLRRGEPSVNSFNNDVEVYRRDRAQKQVAVEGPTAAGPSRPGGKA